ncbi:MAG: hypothetical protein ACFCD0_25835 [Gemmataceae bacterium]
MGQPKNTILFLDSNNSCHSRVAEILFNDVAGKFGLPWVAVSKGLLLEQIAKKTVPITAAALKTLEENGIRKNPATTRSPEQVTSEDLERADRIIAVHQGENQPKLADQFPGWINKVEFWNIEDKPETLAQIEPEVSALISRILGGSGEQVNSAPEVTPEAPPKPKKPMEASVGRETKGRRGKGVTTVFDLPLKEEGLSELATKLKQKCGTGGTVKDGRIEIQGDQRERIIQELEKMGFKVKRVGG